MLNVFANNIEDILSLFNCRHVNHMPTKGKCSFSFLFPLNGSQKFSSPLNSIMTGSICSLNNVYLPRVYNLFASKSPPCTLLTLTPQSFMISTRKSQCTYPPRLGICILIINVNAIYRLQSMRLSIQNNSLTC